MKQADGISEWGQIFSKLIFPQKRIDLLIRQDRVIIPTPGDPPGVGWFF